MTRWTSCPTALRVTLFTLALSSIFGLVTDAAAVPPRERAPHENQQQSASLHLKDTVCSIPGNPDIYGLGIRLGLYLLWVATIFTYECFEDEISNAIDTNLIFFFSISIATFVLSTQSPKPYVEEIYILLILFFGGFWSLAFPSKFGSFSVFGITVRLYLCAAMASYAIWFWFDGMDSFRQQPCGSQAFLFAKVALFGRARIFFKIASVISLVVPAGYMLFMELGLCMPGLISILTFVICVPPLAAIAGLEQLRRGKSSTPKNASKKSTDNIKIWQGLVSATAMFTRPIDGKFGKGDNSTRIPSVDEIRKSKP
jgi:hypothetical protein